MLFLSRRLHVFLLFSDRVNYRRRAQTTALRRKPRRRFDVQVVAVAVVVVVVATAAVKSKRRPELKQINSDSPPNYGASF